MTAVEPVLEETPLPDLATVMTYATAPTGPIAWHDDIQLCLATRWDTPGDPMPMVCARKVHDLTVDPRHLSYRYGGYDQITWTEETH